MNLIILLKSHFLFLFKWVLKSNFKNHFNWNYHRFLHIYCKKDKSIYYIFIAFDWATETILQLRHSTCENKSKYYLFIVLFDYNNLETILQQSCNSGIAHMKVRVIPIYCIEWIITILKQSCNNPATILQQSCKGLDTIQHIVPVNFQQPLMPKG